eukprot:SAG22_NODE_3217_length_1851_cov_1.808219_2_plen_111_part_01
MASLLGTPAGMEDLLGVPFALATLADGDNATEVPLPANLRLVITEYNVMERAGPFKLSWVRQSFYVVRKMQEAHIVTMIIIIFIFAGVHAVFIMARRHTRSSLLQQPSICS